MVIQPVILSGGSGTRLWPLSREYYPKQLLAPFGEYTLLQATIKRLEGLQANSKDVIRCSVKDKRVLSTGYNGSPSGLEHCLNVGCLREQMNIPSGERHELCRAIHAEQNAIIQAATSGVSIEGATLYSTTYPCVLCAKMIINAGIRTIYITDGYPDELSKQLIDEAGVTVHRISVREAVFSPKDEKP